MDRSPKFEVDEKMLAHKGRECQNLFRLYSLDLESMILPIYEASDLIPFQGDIA